MLGRRFKFAVVTSLLISALASSASADFKKFVIRKSGGGNAPQINNNTSYVPGATEFIINESGMKAALGTNDINGFTVSQITELGITRHDDPASKEGAGAKVAPYFNMWVTDGNGKYAVIANEPSNGAFQPLFKTNADGSKYYSLSFDNLKDKVVKIYETPGWNTKNSWVHDYIGKGENLTFNDVAGLQIAAPPADYLAAGNGTGSGAPDELDTNIAYGFNWVFGDTQANYVSGDEGFIVSAPIATATPEPATMLLLGLGGVFAIRRRRKAA